MERVIRVGSKAILESKLRWTLTKSLMKSASLVCEKAKEVVPVKTGRLKRSIDFDYIKSEGNTYYIEIGSDLNYAGFVELGGIKQPPKPYLVPSLKNNINDIIAIIDGELREL